MQNLTKQALLLLSFAVAFSSCKKDDDDNPEVDNTVNQSQFNTTPQPDSPSDADGLMVAISSFTTQKLPISVPGQGATTQVEVQTAVAAFYENNDPNSLLAAGDVTVNDDYDLELLSNNVYTTPYDDLSQSNDLGFSSGSSNSWKVSGSSDVEAFSFNSLSRMPFDIELVGDYSSVNTSSDLTINIDEPSIGADSVLFIIADGKSNIVTYTADGETKSHTFTASQMSNLSGTGIVQVAPYNIESTEVNGKKYYFVNEVVVTAYTEF